MAEDDDAFDFGDFIQSPHPPLSLSHSNGFSSQNDDVWGSFLSSPLPHHQPTTIHSSAQPKPDTPTIKPDPIPLMFHKPNGALPLSLFGEVEDDEEVNKVDDDDDEVNHGVNNGEMKLSGSYDLDKTVQSVKFGDNHQQIMSRNGSGLKFDNSNINNDVDDDDFGDDWEFKGAFPANGVDSKVQGGSSMVAGAKVEPVAVMVLEKQAGQDASKLLDQKPGFSSFFPQSDEMFAASYGAVSRLNEKDVGSKSTAVRSNGFAWDAFPVVGEQDDRSGISATKAEPGSISSLPQSNNIVVPSGTVNRSIDLENVGGKANTATSNGFMWDAFTGAEKVINGSVTSGANIKSDNFVPASSFLSASDDLFALPEGAVSKSSKTDDSLKPIPIISTGLMWDAFNGVEKFGGEIGRNASTATIDSFEHKPGTRSYLPPSDDLFAAPYGVENKSTGTNTDLKSTTVMINSSAFDAFPEVEKNGIRNLSVPGTSSLNEDDDFDDFGDFVDASKDFGKTEKEQDMTHTTVTEAQSPNGKSQGKLTQLGIGRAALPLSLFGDDSEETSETLDHPDEMVYKPASNHVNCLSGQSSVTSIHDLISNLYSQGQNSPSGQTSANIVYESKEKGSPSLGGVSEDDDWDDNSWEFKGAFPGNGLEEQPSKDPPGFIAHKLPETCQNLQIYIDFYTKLRDSLYLLLTCQLDDLRKAQSLDTGTSSKSTEATCSEIQDLLKLVDQSLISQDVISVLHSERSSCLNEILGILNGPDIRVIESEYSLSKKLHLAADDWKVASDLLRHAIVTLKTLSLGSADEQFLYVSTWPKIINVCAQELTHGSSIWKKVSEKKVQHQLLCNPQGKRYIQALGEIYRIVKLLGISAEIYKVWMLLSKSGSLPFTGLLDECCTLWSSSGLKEALQKLSDDNDFGCDGSAKALVASINKLGDSDGYAVHDCIFGQHKSICHLSLLPQEFFSDLKTVLWDGKLYFLNLANLWANLISCNPPQLPHLLVN